MQLYMVKIRVAGRVLRWGNSYGIRVRRADLEKSGVKEGADVVIEFEPKKIDLSHVWTFRGGGRDVSERHDEYLGEGRWRDYQKKSREYDRWLKRGKRS